MLINRLLRKFEKEIEKELKVKESIEESKKVIEQAKRITLDGEGKWLLTKKTNGKAKDFECTCVEITNEAEAKAG